MIAKHAWKARAASSQTSPLTLQAVALAKGVSLHGFSVKVLPSGIDDPSSGNGVFVADGTVPSGVLVALYAGIWFPSLPMDKVQWGTETQPHPLAREHGEREVHFDQWGSQVEPGTHGPTFWMFMARKQSIRN